MSREDLEQQQMGELSEPLFREHEGRWPQDRGMPSYHPSQQIPQDIAYQNRVRQLADAQGQPGTQPGDWGIQPVYDVLPGNGVKFVETDRVQVAFPSIAPNPFFNVTVPQGRIYVFRQLQIEIVEFTSGGVQPPGTLAPLDQTLISIQRGGSTGVETDNLHLGVFGATFDIFAIYSPGETFQVFMNDAGELASIESAVFSVRAFGDSIRQTPYPDTYATLYKGRAHE